MSVICMLVFSYYPADPRVRREAEALIEAGILVDVICMRAPGESKKEFINGVCVLRLPLQRKRAGKLRYIWEYFFFILLSFFLLSFLHLRNRYKLIHVHNMPDILVFSALLPKITGTKIILDLHDPMLEVYMAKYSINASHPVIRLLCFLEKCSIKFSDLVLTVNIACCELLISRGCPIGKIHIVMNSPQESIFRRTNTKIKQNIENNDKFVVMYHGIIAERNGIGVALKALECVRHRIPNIVFHVYGEGDYLNRFLKLVDELGLEKIVKYHGHVSAEEIALNIQSADVGLIPNKPCIQWEICTPTRLFEYLSLGKPVIVPRTKGIMDYFDEKSLFFFESGNTESLAEVIFEVYRNPLQVQAVLERGIKNYQKHRWELEKKQFIKLVKNLLD